MYNPLFGLEEYFAAIEEASKSMSQIVKDFVMLNVLAKRSTKWIIGFTTVVAVLSTQWELKFVS